MTRFVLMPQVGMLAALLFFGIVSALHAQTITTFNVANSTLDPRKISYRYFVADLGTLGGTNSSVFCCFALAINASGQVVGETLISGNTAFHAFRTSANSSINPATDDLGTLGGLSSSALGINDSGHVVGSAATTGSAPFHAFRTAANSPINPATDDLGTLGGTESQANGINASGQVVGYAYISGDVAFHAFRTAANSPINPATDDLGTLGGTWSTALGINDSGQVVGTALLSGNTAAHAFRTAASSPINPVADDLGTLGGAGSAASGINASGQVVGYADVGGANHAFRTAANSPINPATDDLGTLAGTWASFGLGINASGQVVGYALTKSGNPATLPFLYSCGLIYDLNHLIPARSGWDLIVAYGINDTGQIVGIGTHKGLERPFLLTPAQSKEQCKDDGWQTFGFKNQGQCIQFVNTGK